MAFSRDNFAPSYMGQGSNAPKLHTHRDTATTKANLAASGYFNDVTGFLTKGDAIYAHGSDGAVLLSVTSTTGAATVTTEEATLV